MKKVAGDPRAVLMTTWRRGTLHTRFSLPCWKEGREALARADVAAPQGVRWVRNAGFGFGSSRPRLLSSKQRIGLRACGTVVFACRCCCWCCFLSVLFFTGVDKDVMEGIVPGIAAFFAPLPSPLTHHPPQHEDGSWPLKCKCGGHVKFEWNNQQVNR